MGRVVRGVLVVVVVVVGLGVAPLAQAAAPSFAPYATYSTGSGSGPGPAPVNTVAADFTGDGRPDVATTNNFGQRDVILMPNRGDGTFGAPALIPGTSGAQSLAAGDVNGDGHQDLVGMTSSQALIVLGSGTGSFTVAGRYPLTLGGQVQAIILDVNRDERPDVVAPTFNAIQTLLNVGEGDFVAGPRSSVPALGLSSISAARVNRDSNADLFALDGGTASVFSLLGTGSGAFTVAGRLVPSGLIPEDVAAVDLDRGGIDDVAIIGSFSFTLATALSDGLGGFSALTPQLQYAGPGPTSIGVADLDGDGADDLVVSDVAWPPNPSLLVFSGNGTVRPDPAGTFAVDAFPQNPAIADYDGDGRPDIAVAGPGTLSVLINTTA